VCLKPFEVLATGQGFRVENFLLYFWQRELEAVSFSSFLLPQPQIGRPLRFHLPDEQFSRVAEYLGILVERNDS